ncbi:hypothetical protein NST17_20350 [Caldifermentibacillus hisashii]|uniref:Uncharacterized protein n=1 Tax=Caldifermentibacillus hisashii TaxID=996558 RepID=A0ABU9K5C5_9BACI
MVKVIETNLSLQVNNDIIDHQSRVIEVDSWESYVNEIKECKTVTRNSIIGNLHGTTLPRESRVDNLQYDDFHLQCDVYNYAGMRTKKLVYLIKE